MPYLHLAVLLVKMDIQRTWTVLLLAAGNYIQNGRIRCDRSGSTSVVSGPNYIRFPRHQAFADIGAESIENTVECN